MQGHTSSKGSSCFKDLSAPYIQLFLQSCKNGLRSPMVVHFILKRQFEDLFKQFFSILHGFFPHRKLPFLLFSTRTSAIIESQ
jgi:hypothetical protein